MISPPLSLYIHIPWCVQKCPYCDFNSHGVKQAIPEHAYVQHLLDDLAIDATQINGRQVQSIFIGGGTPSLFSPEAIHQLLQGVKARVALAAGAEITLEANPGTVEAEKFTAFRQAGVNRLSIGIQSFAQDKLTALGRIHNGEQAQKVAGYAKAARLHSFNLDLMHGLPGQSVQQALADLETAIAQQPPHLSWYQLTIEPNTQFASRPPMLPEDDTLWEIQQQGQVLLSKAGYEQYEISGYAKPGMQCQHNLNYWRFGDYLGIGCGAHGKISQPQSNQITRTVKVKHPKGYMDLSQPYLSQQTQVAQGDLPFEFFMNRLRLHEACPKQDYPNLTGHQIDGATQQKLQQAVDKQLLTDTPQSWQVSPLGRRYLNSLLELLL